MRQRREHREERGVRGIDGDGGVEEGGRRQRRGKGSERIQGADGVPVLAQRLERHEIKRAAEATATENEHARGQHPLR
jgi:hypothetical protein